MRLWSIHPKYLDRIGLVALWRESLLAKKVLLGKTKGYTKHPQLERFRKQKDSVASIQMYLLSILQESELRGYNFDKSKIGMKRSKNKISVTEGQIAYEFKHLKNKLMQRDTDKYKQLKRIKSPESNPVFVLRKGDVESWEIISSTQI